MAAFAIRATIELDFKVSGIFYMSDAVKMVEEEIREMVRNSGNTEGWLIKGTKVEIVQGQTPEKKMELPISTISNPKNKNMYLVRANYSTDRNRRQICH